MKLALLAIPMLSVLTLTGCATGQAAQPNASTGSMPMAMMSDKQMMGMCMTHMREMTPEMRQQHMEMMRRHQQMIDPKMQPQKPS
jgi:hypothetical protein